MTTANDYISSFELNQIHARRASLTFDEAVAVWLMKWNGDHNHVIAAKLGINQGRVAEVVTGKAHLGAQEKASELRKG